MIPAMMIPMIAVNGLLLARQLDETSPQTGVFWPTVFGQLVILITTIAGFLYTIYRENRNRRWDLEDRELSRAQLAHKVETSQRELAGQVTDRQQVLIDKIDENTEVSKRAFAEANDVNKKIAALGQAIDSVRAVVKREHPAP